MTRFRFTVLAVLGLAGSGIATATPAAEAPAPRPVVTLRAQVSPSGSTLAPGTSLTTTLRTRFRSVPAGGDFVLQRAEYRFGRGARFNGALFPSCSAAKLRKAQGRLSVCPKGSRVGHGVATGRAVAVGIRSSGRLTIFNGPGGRSIVLNFLIVNPALINATFEAPIVRLRGGRYAFKLSSAVPPELQRILDGDVVVEGLDVTTGATLRIGGRMRGYFEAVACPKHGSAVHGDFQFNQGASATADVRVAC
ncbi:MAG TPA: hypothetical protein VFS37_02530 [Conexibacter sp.]|nr:hypothetical protein [Conexibacter sp.]